MNEAAIYITLKVRDLASGPLGKLQEQIAGLSRSSGLSALGGNLAVAGAGITAVGAAVGFALVKTMQSASAVQEQVHRLANVVPEGVAGLRELAMAQKAAADYSMDHAISQEQVLKQLYLGKSAGFDMATSIASMNSASALAIGLGGDMEATQRTLNLAYLNFRDPLKTADQNFKSLSDTMAKATSAFDYKNIEELRSQMELATPTALAAGMGSPEGMKDMIATLADFTRHGLTGSVAGAAFEESLHGVLKMSKNLGIQLVTNKDGGLDYMKSLEQIRTHFISLYGSMSAIPTGTLLEIQKTFGIRGMRALLLDPAEMENMRGQLDHVNGAAAQFQKTMESSPAAQWEIFKNKLEALSITIGGALLPSAIHLIGILGSIVEKIVRFAQAHPALVKFVALFAAISAGVLMAVGSLLVLAGAVASGIAAFAALGIAGPIVAGIVAVGIAVAGVIAALDAFFPKLFDAGLNIVKMIAKGILAGVSHAISAISTVAKAIRDHLPFSPAKIGPLRDLGHIRVSETIAAAIRPAPVMRAMSSVAAGIAMTGAMMGTPAYAATAGSPPISISMPVTVNGDVYDGDGFRKALETHKDDLIRVFHRELANLNRSEF